MDDLHSHDSIAEDVHTLERMGYGQELLRRMSGFSNFAVSFSIICVLAGGINSYQQGFCAAGGASIGIGMLANSLTLGCDCLGVIRYFDAHMTNSRGELFSISNAVCMHEEDYGVLWKHTDWRTNQTDSSMQIRRWMCPLPPRKKPVVIDHTRHDYRKNGRRIVFMEAARF